MSYFWENEKIELRLVKESDIDFFSELLKNTRTRMQANHGIALPQGWNEAEALIDYALSCNQSEEELWFLIYNKEETAVGYAVIDWINERMGNAQCHVTICEEYRRKGYGSYATALLLEYLFMERRFEKVGCNILETSHVSSGKFVSKLGFRMDAFRSEIYYTQGKYVGEYYYSILRQEFLLWKKQGWMIEAVDKEVPDSELGKKTFKETGASLPIYDGRDDFWCFEDIKLREMTEEDYLKNHEILFDTESCIMYDSSVKLPDFQDELTEEEEEHIALQMQDNRIEFAMDNEKGDYVGNINLCGIDQKNGKFSFSIYILPEYRGNGYGKKALRLIMTYCFEELRMHKMISRVNDGNVASAVLMRSVGCHVEGVLRHEVYYHGEYVDVILFGVTKDAFYKKHGY